MPVPVRGNVVEGSKPVRGGAGGAGPNLGNTYGTTRTGTGYKPGQAGIGGAGGRPNPPALPPPPGAGGGGAKTSIAEPTAPTIGEWNIDKEEDPEFARARQRAEGYLGELETGSGYASEVMQGNMQGQIDSDVQRAKEDAAAQGIPFDEGAFRRDAQSKMQGALAQEKLGRESLRGNMMANLQGVIGGGAENKLAKSGLELQRISGRTGAELQKYGQQGEMYKTNVNAKLQEYQIAMQSLRDFLNLSFSA